MRLLVCVFTYNRPRSLLNLVRSTDAFFPWGDRLVVDDGSHEPAQAKALAAIEQRAGWRVTRKPRASGGAHGGYPENLRWAIGHALHEGYDYIFSLEDDWQFLWQKDDYPAFVERLFRACPDAIQLQPLFARRILDYSADEYLAPVEAYRTNRGFSPVGVLSLARVRAQADFTCFAGAGFERLNSGYWLQRGYRLYRQAHPTVACLAWGRSADDETGRPSSREPWAQDRSEYLLSPLDARQIALLLQRDPSLPPYQEYFELGAAFPGRPVWHRRGRQMGRYYQLCHETVARERATGEGPARLRIAIGWAPSRVAPCASHLSGADAEHPKPCDISRRRSLRRLVSRRLPVRWRRRLGDALPRRAAHVLAYVTLCAQVKAERRRFLRGDWSRPDAGVPGRSVATAPQPAAMAATAQLAAEQG